jgi:CubicO group peptidase (beta-lactamase class C family)
MRTALFWSALVGLGGAVAWGLARFWRVVAIGSAYKAKVLTSALFGTGRAIDPRRAEEVSADSYWIMRVFDARVDSERGSVTVSFFGLRPRAAVYRSGLGATLVPPGSDPPGLVGPAALPEATENGHQETYPTRGQSPRLERVVALAFTEPNPRRLRRTRAIVIVHDGRIVAERYAPGFTESTRLAGWSVTKGVMSALVGVLVGEGRLALGDKELLPDWRAPDARSGISVEDLLRMRSGLRFSEVYSDLASDVIEMLFNRPDTAAYAASLPLDHPPGTVWSYSSGTTNILSKIVRRIVGEPDYFEWPQRSLFGPIGMTSAILEPDAAGTFVGSSFMLATARDWARFGELYLQEGVWNGRRVLPEGWVRFSASPTPESPDGIYGAHWWLGLNPELGGGTPAAERLPRDAFFAVGHEGQTLTIVPSLDLVVVRFGLSIHIDAWNHAEFLASVRDAL